MKYDYSDLIKDINNVLQLPIEQIYETVECYKLDARGKTFHAEVNQIMLASEALEKEQASHIAEVSFKLVVLSNLMDTYNQFITMIKDDPYTVGHA